MQRVRRWCQGFRFEIGTRGVVPCLLLLTAACSQDDERPPRIGTLYGDGDPEPPALTCSVTAAGGSCSPPQLLIVLDRSTSMVTFPDGTFTTSPEEALVESKWRHAIDAIDHVTRSSASQRVAFGLELFPRDPGDQNACVALEQVVTTAPRSALKCREGALLVPPCIDTGEAIAEALDINETTLCGITPMGAALDTARDTLTAMYDPPREQYVLFVTDGYDSCADERPVVEAADDLWAAGVGIFVVGFAGINIDPWELSDLACAGHTADDFEAQCVEDEPGRARYGGSGDLPFLFAEDGPALEAALLEITARIECPEIR